MKLSTCLIFYFHINILINNIVATNVSLMEKHEIVPDVIDRAPQLVLSVSYEKEVNLGNELTPLEVKDQPKVTWNAEPEKYYTLAMVDPDAPSRTDPKFREVKHWLVVNIKGNNLKNGEVIGAYMGSGPPKGTGLHRYIFLLYTQPHRIVFSKPQSPVNSRANRLNFSIRKFAEKYNLGDAVAGNFYQAQWDEYVEVRNKGITN